MESDKLKELQNKCYTATKRLKKAFYECSPTRRKSEFITCPNCGSRYPKKFQHVPVYDFAICRICYSSSSLYSATSIKRIENCQRKLMEIDKLIVEEEERLEKSAHC